MARARFFSSVFPKAPVLRSNTPSAVPGRCGAIVVLTGGIFGLPEERSFPPHLLDGLRVFLTGSDVDDWIPLQDTQRTERVLTELGAEVQLRIYKGRPHIVSPEELAAAREFITTLFTI